MKKKLKKSEFEEGIIKVLLNIAKSGEKEKGAIVVFGGSPKYKSLKKENFVKPFNILNDLSLFETLCLIDGAVIIDKKGMLIDYGVSLDRKKVLVGYGTRNAAAISASTDKEVISVFMATATEAKVKIFKQGKIVLQIDALQKGIEKKTSEISNLLESLGIGTLGAVSAGIILPIAGFSAIAFAPGVLIFGTTAWIIQKLKEMNKR